MILLCPGSAGLLYGLAQVAGASAFASPEVLVPMLVGLVLVAGFIVWSLTRASAPLIDVRLFRHRSVASSASLLFLGGISLIGSMILLPLYFQQVRGATALDAGLLLIPQGVGALLAQVLAGKYMDMVGPRVVALLAFAFVALSTVPFAFVTADTDFFLRNTFWWSVGLTIVAVPLCLLLLSVPDRSKSSNSR